MKKQLMKNSFKPVKIRLLKNDIVIVRSGKYKGKTGKVLATHPSENKVTVEGINIFKKHLKPNKQHPQGGIIDITKPIWVSKVAVIEPASKKASRIAYEVGSKGDKKRVLAGSRKEIK